MKQTNKLSKAKMILGVYLLSVSMGLVACNKNQNNSAPAAPVNIYGPIANCPNCVTNPQALLVGVKSATNADQGLFGLDIIAYGPVNVNMTDPKAAVFYSGPVAISGVLRVTIDDYTFCHAPPGDYQIRTLSVGQMTAGTISGVVVEALGPVRMVIQIKNSQLETKDSPMIRIGMNTNVQMVNNMYCGDVSTY